MSDISEAASDAVNRAESASDSSFNNLIAACVAILATLMAIFNIKDGNLVQAMAQAQAKAVDSWSYFQAKSAKHNLAEAVLDQLLIEQEQISKAGTEANALLEAKIKVYRAKVQQYETEKAQIKQEAEGYEQEYDRLNRHDDQFDLAEACLTLAISLLGIAALTKKPWLLYLALGFAAIGFYSGVAGFLGWDFHPDLITNLLS